MPNVGAPEILLILVIVVIVFGAGKLPETMRSLGRGVREFRDASEGKAAAAEEPASAARCAKCGSMLPSEAKFCPNCGTARGASG